MESFLIKENMKTRPPQNDFHAPGGGISAIEEARRGGAEYKKFSVFFPKRQAALKKKLLPSPLQEWGRGVRAPY